MERRIITTQLEENENVLENHLRPQYLSEYIGQEKAKEILKVYIEAAKKRKEALDHVLLYGPPGLGKTTLAGIIANEMGSNIKITSGPAIDIMIGKGATARSIRLDLPKFTLVGATTRVGLLTAPLRDRFGVVHKLDFYTTNELVQVLERSANVLDVTLEKEGALELARRSRGTPRLANRLLKRVRDFAQVRYDSVITKEVAEYALDLLEVDRLGLDKGDRAILETIADKFGGGPVGLDTIAAALGEDSGTIEDVYEPYLIQNGLIERTPRGRAITRLAYEHLHRPVPKV